MSNLRHGSWKTSLRPPPLPSTRYGIRNRPGAKVPDSVRSLCGPTSAHT
jgi:hypothetical protein